jgi:ribosomal protein S18 acetylase RimI-like enzyme
MAELRWLVERDAERLRAVVARMRTEEHRAFGWLPGEAAGFTAEDLRRSGFFPAEGAAIVGAFEGDELVALVRCDYSPWCGAVRHRAEITTVYTIPEARGRGLARALIVEALRRWRAGGEVEDVALGVIVPNPAARALYASLGFRTWGIKPRSYRMPDGYVDSEQMLLRLADFRDPAPIERPDSPRPE